MNPNHLAVKRPKESQKLQTDTATAARRWPSLAAAVRERLTADDDPAFWEAAVEHLLAEAEHLLLTGAYQKGVQAQIGRCSHWLRPHQTRWTEGGGFAWPSGYGGFGYSRNGLPEFDWSCVRRWDPDTASWEAEETASRKGRLLFRAALPARTARHAQAAVHTLWTPGPPGRPRQKLCQFYGFRRRAGRWLCTAFRGDERTEA
jgi:hypothetical protein